MEKSQRGRELVPASIAAAVALAGATAIYFMDFGLGTGVQLPGTTPIPLRLPRNVSITG